MNQHLQIILNLIEQKDNLSADEKNALVNSLKDADKELKITAFKLERTEKVKRTTAILLEETIEELEQKRESVEVQNRELEIESSLERVRTVAMSMNKPDDMLEVCKTIAHQLQSLGVKEIRNVQTAIFYEASGTYMNYEFYARHDKTFVTETIYTNHKIASAFAEKMLRGKGEVYSTSIKGKEVKDWLDYQKSTNVFIDTFLENAGSLNYYWHSLGPVALGISTYEPLTETDLRLFQRFLKVFDLSYRRYLDIEKAIVQAKEAQIETSLERIRAQAMAMRTPQDLTGICEVLYAELHALGFGEIRNAMINIHDDEKETFMNYDFSDEIGKSINHLAYNIHPVIEKQIKQMRSAGDAFSETYFKGKDLADWKSFRKSIGEKDDPRMEHATALYYYFYSIGTGSIGISTFSVITGEKLDVIKRFRNVFNLSYQRYTDLALAEAQAREAQIELALERVRARTMAMQKSDELAETAYILYQQFKKLGENPHQITIGIIKEVENVVEFNITGADGSGDQINRVFTFNIDEPALIQKLVRAWKDNKKSTVIELAEKDLTDWVAHRNLISGIIDNTDYSNARRYVGVGFFTKGLISISTVLPIAPETNVLLERFAQVFDQTYTRFLDLQKAEAQAREAQIETALERVRARTMAMYHSNDLASTSAVLFQQIKELGFEMWSCGFCIWKKDDLVEAWMGAGSGELLSAMQIPYKEEPTHNDIYEASLNGEIVHEKVWEGKALEEHYAFMQTIPSVKKAIEQLKEAGLSLPGKQCYYAGFFKQGYLLLITREPTADAADLTKRFARVFDQTYTRFLDLQKAEAQAREAQIETALERVRSRTLAMHTSDELAETAAVVFRQLINMGIAPNRLYIGIIKDDKGHIEFWVTDEDGSRVSTQFTGDTKRNDTIKKMYDAWAAEKKSLTIDMNGPELENYFQYLAEDLHVPFKFGLAQKRRVQNIAFFGKGFIGIASPDPQPEETIFLLERFAAVFNLTYTRFNDLQVAEAQTHKANIEVALERVRARALAMQEPEELIEVAEVMRHEMGLLGVEELETSSIYINKENGNHAECWYALKDVRVPEKKLLADHFDLNYNDTRVGRQMLNFYKIDKKEISIIMQGDDRKEWIKYCAKQSPVLKGYYGEVIPDRTYHLCKFSNGSIGAATPGDISIESWDLLRRAASVFSLAYSRFKDLTKARTDLQQLKEEKQRAETALNELKATQTQLIQSEKMASLGELTAGIAHEIQNPLNFVNNFSEVSNELMDEMNAEIEKGDLKEAKLIGNDIKQNLEKINHHGKRADAIVKGMLQHSRSSSAIKEPTDINKLADEYLRLAYHGLRAKDKSFNATMKTDFDDGIGNINIIPQDIGRVILNLITNAFYVVDEKKKSGIINYEPTVSVSTTKLLDKVEIKVKDNGNGIPPKVMDKIFQPFFTTKPTGQGTGLGLSLSYDIVKAHGGELKVDTKDGEGSVFIIKLPV